MRHLINIVENAQDHNEITRWVDERAALSYIHSNAMIGRVRHWLPKQISGLDKIYAKTGLSFGIKNTSSHWNAHGYAGICFIIDRSRLTNLICDIDGHAVYTFSQVYDNRYLNLDSVEQYRRNAIESSQKHPDEAFVVGDIRDLGSKLTHILVGKKVRSRVLEKIISYAKVHNISVEKD